MPTSQRPSARAPGVGSRSCPAEALGALAQAGDEVARGERQAASRGRASGSLRMRSSIGSMPAATASSSIADSSANMPGHSPGARIHDGVGTSSATRRWRGAPVGRRVHDARGDAVCSANSAHRRGLLERLVGDRGEAAVGGRAEADALDRRRAVADDGEHLLAGQRDLDRAARPCARRSRRARTAAAGCPWSRSRRRRAGRRRARARARGSNTWAMRAAGAVGALDRVVEREVAVPPRSPSVACGSIALLCIERRSCRSGRPVTVAAVQRGLQRRPARCPWGSRG